MPELTKDAAVRIARLALFPPPGMSPDALIERELESLGMHGPYLKSIEFQRAHQRVCDLRAELREKEGRIAVETIDASYFWAAYEGGMTQSKMSRLLHVDQTAIASRSADLGFVLTRSGPYWTVTTGPCLGCGEPLAREALDASHACLSCRSIEDDD